MKQLTIYIAALLLLLASFCPGLVHSVFIARQASVRARMKKELEMQFLQTVQQKEQEVRWAKPGKEIWVGNSLFDIKTALLKDGIYTFTGLFDKDETVLVMAAKEQREKSKNGSRILTAFLQWVKTRPPVIQLPTPPDPASSLTNKAAYPAALPQVFLGIYTPPPEMS